MMILIMDTEFSDISPEMELLSLALVSLDGQFEFYGERTDVPREHCSDFVRHAVLPQLKAGPPVAGDIHNLRARLRAFVEALPDKATLACDSFYDIELFSWAIGKPWPKQLDGKRLNLAKYTSIPAFSQAQHRYHSMGHAYHHALNDVRALRAGMLAWQESRQ